MIATKTVKPLGGKAYGHICHLPGSRLGPGDHKLNLGQAMILIKKARDEHDRIIVTEKLDGTNVAVARVDSTLIPLMRAGYPAIASHYEQHRLFANWVFERLDRFEFLRDGERLCGEWLAQVHSTRYQLLHEPFIVFDIFSGKKRWCHDQLKSACIRNCLSVPAILSDGPPCPIEKMLEVLGTSGHHGAIDPAEGAVWRVERRGEVDFLGKFVRPGKLDGRYLPQLSGQSAIWNWRP